MTQILIRPAECRSKAYELRRSAFRIRQAMLQVDRDMQIATHIHMEGERACQLYRRYQSQRQQMLHASDIIIQFAVLLEQAADAFQRADQSALQLWPPDLVIDFLKFVTRFLGNPKTIGNLFEVATELFEKIASGRGDLWKTLHKWGLDKELYDTLKNFVPKGSTSLGKSLKKFVKNIPVIEIVVGTGIDFWDSEKHNFDAFFTALGKNALETLISPFMLANTGVQIVGSLTTAGLETIIPVLTDDPLLRQDLQRLNEQVEKNLERIDLENLTKDIGGLVYHASPLYLPGQTADHVLLGVLGQDPDQKFWQEPSMQNAWDLFTHIATQSQQDRANHPNMMWNDAKDFVSHTGDFVVGLGDINDTLVKTGMGYGLALSTRVVDSMPLSPESQVEYAGLVGDTVFQISQLPPLHERKAEEIAADANRIFSGDLNAADDLLIDMWTFALPPGFSHLKTFMDIGEIGMAQLPSTAQ